MRRARAPEAVSPPRRDDASARPRDRAPADDVLALQQAAGNRAVSALLARQPHTTAAPGKPAPKEAAQGASHVLMPGIGTVPLVSFSWGGGETHNVGPGKADIRDIHITSRVGPHSELLQKAITEGRHFKQAELVHHGSAGAGVRIRMTDVLGTTYQLAGVTEVEHEVWSLTFASVEFEQIRD